MKKSDFSGWKEVYSFSFKQGIKEKSYIIFLVIMFVVMLAVKPVMTLMSGDDDEQENPTAVEKLMVYDTTGLPIAYEKAAFAGAYKDVKVEKAGATKQEYDAFVETLAVEDTRPVIAVLIEFSEYGSFDLTFTKPAKGMDKEDASGLADSFTEYFAEAKLTAMDVTPEQYAFINRPVVMQCKLLGSDGEVTDSADDEGISMGQYYVLLGGIMVVMLLISFSGNSIATSIVTEKSTRVIEYLMINVRPMALLVGKILGCLTLTIIQFATIGIGYFGSGIITRVLFGVESDDQVSIVEIIAGFSPLNLTLALAGIIIGVLFFCMLAGLAGASASKMEEMQEGMKLFSFSMIIGSYVGIFLCIMQLSGSVNPILLAVCCLIPISAPFIVPVNLLAGNISLGLACAGLALTLTATVLLFLFAANVYEALIFHNGKVLKLKDIIGIARTRKVSAAGKGGK